MPLWMLGLLSAATTGSCDLEALRGFTTGSGTWRVTATTSSDEKRETALPAKLPDPLQVSCSASEEERQCLLRAEAEARRQHPGGQAWSSRIDAERWRVQAELKVDGTRRSLTAATRDDVAAEVRHVSSKAEQTLAVILTCSPR